MIRFSEFPVLAVLLLTLMAEGCGRNPQGDKKSLFQHEHQAPAHWPNDVSDLCDKIRSRLDSVPVSQPSGPSELDDLIAWIPEIAADCNLTEAQWLPICEASESLQLRTTKHGWTEQTRAEARSICDRLSMVTRSLSEEKDGVESGIRTDE